MIDTIEVTINGKLYNYTKDITLQEIYSEHQEGYKYPILLARVNNCLRELSYELKENCEKNVVLGIAGNKCDKYEQEQVQENDAKEFAEKVNAAFQLTSAQNNTGIDELFEELGSKYLDPNFQQKIKDSEEEKIQEGRGDNIVLTKEAAAKKNPAAKKGCC